MLASGLHSKSASNARADRGAKLNRECTALEDETAAVYGPLHNRSVARPFPLAAFLSKFIGEQ